MNRRRMIGIMALALTLGATGLSGAVLAASSQADSAALAYPELKIRANGTAFELPAEVVAGRHLVTVDNQGEEGIDTQIILVPEGRTVEEVDQAHAAGDESSVWLYDATWAGGPTVLAGAQAQTIVDLAAGTWAIVAAGYAPSSLTVTAAPADAPAPVEPEVAAIIDVQEYGFVALTDEIQAGKQVWKITNIGEQPHFLELVKAPGPVTVDQAMAMMMAMGDPNATPAPDAIDPATIEGVGGIATISPGQTGWYVTDLEPGTYIALCFVPDRDAGVPHAMMGMVQVFTVGAAAAPAP